MKRTALVISLVCILLIAFAVPVMAAYTVDDAKTGNLPIGEKVKFGSYNWCYLGKGVFVLADDIWINAVFSHSTVDDWSRSALCKRLNDSTYVSPGYPSETYINLGVTDSGYDVAYDPRVAYVAIPTVEQYTELRKIQKGGGYTDYWVYDEPTNVYCVGSTYGLALVSSIMDVSHRVRPTFRLKTEILGGGLTADQVKQMVKDAIAESSVINNITSNSNTAAADATASKKMLDGTSNGSKSLANTYDAANEARNAARKKAIKLVAGTEFFEIVYDDLTCSTQYYNTGTSSWVSGTPPTGSSWVTVTPSGLGYSVVTGKINESGAKVVVFGSRGLIFNVIAKPTISSTATLTFGS